MRHATNIAKFQNLSPIEIRLLPPCQINPAQYQHTSCQCHRSKMFAKQQYGARQRENRIKVKIVGSRNHADALQYDVPNHKAYQRSQHT